MWQTPTGSHGPLSARAQHSLKARPASNAGDGFNGRRRSQPDRGSKACAGALALACALPWFSNTINIRREIATMTLQDNGRPGFSRRQAIKVATIAGFTATTGLLHVGPAHAQDSMNALLTPLPPQAPATEGLADLGDAKLWFWDTGGPGEAVVFLHPNSGSHEFYPHQQPAFAKAGYRAISYSRRGRYQSEAGENPRESIPADDILNLMKHLKVEKFHLVGNAAGGSIALDVAISHPDRVLSLVVASAS
jgi:hypothetical protein